MNTETIYVNGYGAAMNVGYVRYLSAVSDFIRSSPETHFTVYLCGGCTDRLNLSEAACMSQILRGFGVPDNASLILVEDTMTARENLQAARRLAGDVPIAIFYELSRTPTMWFLSSREFSSVQLMGIGFDPAALRIGHRLKQVFLHFPLEVLAYHIPIFDRLRLALRRRRIAKARRQNE